MLIMETPPGLDGEVDGSTARSESPSEISIVVELPTGVSVTLQSIIKAECGMGIRQALSELLESCFFTCFTIVSQEDPTQEVNDYVDLNDYPFMEDGVKLKMILEDYDVRKARAHVKKFKELIAYPPASHQKATGQGSKEGDEESSQQQGSPTKASIKTKATPAATGNDENAKEGANGTAVSGSEQPESNGDSSPKEPQSPEEEEDGGGEHEEDASTTSKGLQKAQLRELIDRLPLVELPMKADLEPFYNLVLGPSSTPSTTKKEHGIPQCLRSVSFSGWNPPPAPRRFLGDLLYLEIRTLDDTVLNITAVPGGFYVNKTSHERFDPSPATNCYFSHELSTLIMAASLSFKKAWTAAVNSAAEHQRIENPLEALALAVADGRLDTSVIKPPWNVPHPPPPPTHHRQGGNSIAADVSSDPLVAGHKWDTTRCEDDMLNTFGMDERGALRDWNEDYQNVREMPRKDIPAKVLRAKIMHKVVLDFEEAALSGAMAIIKGHVTPINPNEPRKGHVYVFNNIFFSHALDAQNTFKLVEGDGPAFKSALHEIRNVKYLNKLEIPKLYTLATAVVDYVGVRLVAQSIIPGILQGDQQSRLMYGSVEPGVRLKAKKEVHTLLQDVAKGLLLTERVVPACPISARAEDATGVLKASKEEEAAFRAVAVDDEDEAEEGNAHSKGIKFIGPVEWKGIKGADGRCYMLDLVRLTPRDPNWMEAGIKGTDVFAFDGMGALESDTSMVLRPELIQVYFRHQLSEIREKIIKDYQEKKLKQKAEEEAAGGGKKQEEIEGDKTTEVTNGKEEKGGAEESSVATTTTTTTTNGTAEKEEEEASPVSTEKEEEQEADPELMKALREAEADLLERMKVNTNVFLPLEGADEEGVMDQEQESKDEQHVCDLAKFLWHQLLPSFLEEVKRGGTTPLDGETLTDNLHQAGINMRYLGRLATLAKAIKPSQGFENRYRCPTFFIQLCEIEMVARALKHVIYEALRDRADLRAAPGLTVVHCLNAAFGSSAASSSPNSTAASPNSDHAAPQNGHHAPASKGAGAATTGGGKKSKSRVRRGHSSTTTTHLIQPQRQAPPPPCLELSLDEVRDLLVADIRRRYRYHYVFPAGGAADLANAPALLRRVCQKLGVRLYNKNYDFTSHEPFVLKDVVDIVATVKSCQPSVGMEEARDLYENGRMFARAGSTGVAFEYIQEATHLYQQIFGPIHKDVAACHDLLATLLLQSGDQELAVHHMKKALVMHWQTGGFDSYEAINAHHHLAIFLSHSKAGARTDEAVFHMRACIYLLELIAGPTHPELASQYLRLGQIYQEVSLWQPAYQCMLMALEKSRHITDPLQEAHIAHQVTSLEGAAGLFKEALAHEKRAYAIFKDVLGEGHSRTIDSSLYMKTFTSKAVEAATSTADKQKALQQQQDGSSSSSKAEDSWTVDLDSRMGKGAGGAKKKKAGTSGKKK